MTPRGPQAEVTNLSGAAANEIEVREISGSINQKKEEEQVLAMTFSETEAANGNV